MTKEFKISKSIESVIAYNPPRDHVEREWRGEYVARDEAQHTARKIRSNVRAVLSESNNAREMSRTRFAALSLALFGAGLYLAPVVSALLF